MVDISKVQAFFNSTFTERKHMVASKKKATWPLTRFLSKKMYLLGHLPGHIMHLQSYSRINLAYKFDTFRFV